MTPSIPTVTVTVDALRDRLAALCPDQAIDLAGAVPLPVALPHREAWLDWVASGRHAGLEYLARDPEGRADPTRRDPWARALLVFAQRYTDGWPADDPSAREGITAGGTWIDGVARYARGDDYHEVLHDAIAAVLRGLADTWPGLRAHPAVDTGPYLEREYALLAGLGFVGKNTCLIHERLGSGLFLGTALTNLAITGLPAADPGRAEPLYATAPRPHRARIGPAAASRCGSCTRCLEACPTGALVAPYVMDANLCLATWTIEWKGHAPAAARHRQGGIVFGCDICQAVCPWNVRAARRAADGETEVPPPPPAYATRADHAEIALADLIVLGRDAFRQRFRATAIWRCHPEGLRRNVMVAVANARRRDLRLALGAAAQEDPDPEARQVATWATDQLGEEA